MQGAGTTCGPRHELQHCVMFCSFFSTSYKQEAVMILESWIHQAPWGAFSENLHYYCLIELRHEQGS